MKTLFSLAVAMLGVMGTPAMAQGDVTFAVPNAQARVTMAKFAKCLIRTSGRSWRALLKQPIGGEGLQDQFRRNVDSGCLQAQRENDPGAQMLTIPPYLLRSNLFDALYRADFATQPAITSFEAVPVLVYPVADGANEGEAHQYLVSMSLGDCVGRRAPAESRTFLLSDVNSPEETSTLQALAPAFAACVPQGTEMSLTRAKARAALAEPLYRLTQGQVNP